MFPLLYLQVKYYNAESFEVEKYRDAILKFQVSIIHSDNNSCVKINPKTLQLTLQHIWALCSSDGVSCELC